MPVRWEHHGVFCEEVGPRTCKSQTSGFAAASDDDDRKPTKGSNDDGTRKNPKGLEGRLCLFPELAPFAGVSMLLPRIHADTAFIQLPPNFKGNVTWDNLDEARNSQGHPFFPDLSQSLRVCMCCAALAVWSIFTGGAAAKVCFFAGFASPASLRPSGVFPRSSRPSTSCRCLVVKFLGP